MRILWLTPELPYAPGGSGGSTRQFHLIRRLVERGHALDVVAPVHPSQRDGAASLAAVGASLYGIHRPPGRAREAATALARRPRLAFDILREPVAAWQVDVFWTSLRRLAHAATIRARPDVIVVEHDWAAGWVSDLPRGIPRALTLHNLSWVYYETRAAAERPPRRWGLAVEADRFRRHDAVHLQAFDLLLTMSEQERETVAALVPTRTAVVPNGVDVSSAAGPPPRGTDPLLLFTGTLSYPPNSEALLWLLREIWPRLRAARPDVRLRVVGRGVPREALELADERVEITGWVESTAPHFAAASVVLVPIRSGAGTRLKVLDGMAAARPVVSTSLGAAGIVARDDEHLVIADDAQGFAAAVGALLDDPARASELATAGRALAEGRYDWNALGERLEAELSGLARGARGSATSAR